jgi:hypothetical protein
MLGILRMAQAKSLLFNPMFRINSVSGTAFDCQPERLYEEIAFTLSLPS